MSSLTNIYYFVSLATTKTHFVITDNNIDTFIEQNVRKKLDVVLHTILNQKYIYHFVKRNVLIINAEPLIATLKKNKIRLDQLILQTRNEIAYEKRLILGANNENELKPIIERNFGVNLVKTENRYDNYDFYDVNRKYVFEIKSLIITYNVFIGANKIANVGDFKLIFIFKCNASRFIYYLIYSKELFESLELRNIELRGKLKLSPMFIIPVKYLTLLNQNDRIILD
jgi:hypothetical protein